MIPKLKSIINKLKRNKSYHYFVSYHAQSEEGYAQIFGNCVVTLPIKITRKSFRHASGIISDIIQQKNDFKVSVIILNYKKL